MHIPWAILASIALSSTHVSATPAKRHYDTHRYYALEHRAGENSGATLDDVAEALGVEVIEQAGELKDVWLVRVPKPNLTARENFDPVIAAFNDLQEKASLHLTSRSEETLQARAIVASVNFLEPQIPAQLVKRAPPPIRPPTRTSSLGVAKHFGFKDPLFTEQWHIVNDDYPEHMLNVTPVWDMGITGKGVLSSFVDDGLDFETDDLKDAFDAENSYDFNAHVPLPRPTGARDHHGTRCAGQVAARRNEACGVGIAFNSKAAGIRMLAGPISPVDEAAALNYGYKNVDIYSCSWGPRDNGEVVDAPGYLIRKAVVNGITNGRNGKGSIFVFASGNGGRKFDQCNFDGYTNSIYSVTVASIDHKGLHPSYSEPCAANLVVAYSSGSGKRITTTDRANQCTLRHGGTSAAAPNAVGVIALALEIRPDLTWRDIQYIAIKAARKVNTYDPDWQKTATGDYYSYKYGYGAMDAYAYVTVARDWKLVKPQAWYHTETVIVNEGSIHRVEEDVYRFKGGIPIPAHGIEQTMTVTKEMLVENNLESLEHINVRVWISHTKRGDVEVEIESPNGIRSVLAGTRKFDESERGFPGWRFMSVKHWGENPVGEWKLRVYDQNNPKHHGKFLGWNMEFWGAAIDATKVKHFLEPVVDNALPPIKEYFPPRPIPNDPDVISMTQHGKPTDFLPTDHGHATGENSRLAFPAATGRPKPGSQQEDDAVGGGVAQWYNSMMSLVSAQKWFFAALGAVSVLAVGAIVYFWRRRVARERFAKYTSLAADEDISMDAIGESRVTTAAAAAGGGSDSHLPATARPPTGRALGFHSGFLDDDEPSAGLGPKYRDEEPGSAHPSAAVRRSEDDGDDEASTPAGSRAGSRERLTS